MNGKVRKVRAVVRSMRLRTLPLSLAGCIVGVALAFSDYRIDPTVVFLVLLTTVLLQILSNFSNELGDALHGTDTEVREGPQYSILSGELTVKEMKRAIRIFVLLSVISGMAMIYVSFGTFFSIEAVLLLLLGLSAIISGMKYTLGRNPYGYFGWGDFFVFIYFGIVSVLGSYFVVAHTLPTGYLVLPAVSMGLFSIAVLNLNNIRDMKTDAVHRITVALLLGVKRAKIYETALIAGGWAFLLAFCGVRYFDPWHYLFVLTLPGYVWVLKLLWTKNDRELDPVLPLLVLSTFGLALLLGFGYIRFLLVP